MSRKLVSAACAAALLFAAPMSALSQSAPAPSAPAAAASATDNDAATYARKLELAKRYMKAARLDETLAASFKAVGGAMTSQMEGQFPDMPKGWSQALTDSLTATYAVELRKITDQMIPIIAKIYTEEELTKITEFMESPVGQSMISKSPQVSAALVQAMPSLMTDFQNEFGKQFCSRVDCSAPGMERFKPQSS